MVKAVGLTCIINLEVASTQEGADEKQGILFVWPKIN